MNSSTATRLLSLGSDSSRRYRIDLRARTNRDAIRRPPIPTNAGDQVRPPAEEDGEEQAGEGRAEEVR